MPKKSPKDNGLVFPSALRHARKAAGFRTHIAFAKACTVHPETVGRYERGTHPPSDYMIRHMIQTIRDTDPHANLAALEQAAEQDRRTFWSMEPIGAPAESADLPPNPRRDIVQGEQLLEQLGHQLTPEGRAALLSEPHTSWSIDPLLDGDTTDELARAPRMTSRERTMMMPTMPPGRMGLIESARYLFRGFVQILGEGIRDPFGENASAPPIPVPQPERIVS